jgi:alkaline phosphatase D
MMAPVQRITRRGFLLGALATLVAACRSSDRAAPAGPSTSGSSLPAATDTATPPTPAPTTTAPPTTTLPPVPELPADPFTLGVASGDALTDAVVLWTRLAPDPSAVGGRAGMPDADVPVVWEIATSEDFAAGVASGIATASPDHAHSVHVDVPNLDPATTYWYRFKVGPYTSAVGRTVTMPAGDAAAASLVIGHASCQHYETGLYAAHRDIAAAHLDALIWLGDYIYEGRAHPVGEDGAIRSHNGAEPTDLPGYRDRYALYRSDPDLRAAHASTGWYVIWDDHEVQNNYAADHSADPSIPEATFHARRAAAYQAWWEHQPVRLPPPMSADYQIYRSFALGPLGQLFLLDGRQYRSDQACGDRAMSFDPACPETFAPGRTMLGDAQEHWLLDGLAATTGTWNVIGNQTVMTDVTLNGAVLNYDQWDGYPDARQRLVGGIDRANLTNVVTITGDIHAALVADLAVDDENGHRAVGSELITSSISSTSNLPPGSEALLSNFNDIHYADGIKRGWVRSTLTATGWDAEYRAVDDVTRADSTISVSARFHIDPTTPGALRTA